MDSIVWSVVGIIAIFCLVGNVIALWTYWDDICKMLFNKDKQL